MSDGDPGMRSSDQDLPLADELLSEQSRAWVKANPGDPNKVATPSTPVDDHLPRITGYQIGRRVGRGGMGTVYECTREGSTERLAIKIISTGHLAGDEERRRFMSEIGMLLRLHHPYISHLRDFGQEGAAAWFVMDFIAGKPFHEWVSQDKPDYQRMAALLGHAARAVAHAHRQGIIHRDLNPANLMVMPDGHPVIMDFGLGRDLAANDGLTISGMTVGTPPYMSPEQTLGTKGEISIRTDVWGMGGILYDGLTSRPPFNGTSNHEIFTKINEEDPVNPRAIVSAVPLVLERIALRCLQRNPADRYPDLDALASDLESFAGGQSIRVRLPSWLTRLRRRVQRRPLPWMLAAALFLTGTGFLGYAAIERVRRMASWSEVVDADLTGMHSLPVGLSARNGFFEPVAMTEMPDELGLGPVQPQGEGLPGWWWFEGAGLQGGVRVEVDLDMPINDALELGINASSVRPRDLWHHPAGWVAKIQSAEVLSTVVTYQDAPGPLRPEHGILLERPSEMGTRLHVTIDARDTFCTVQVDGCEPITVSEPLALGGSDRRAICLRFFNPATRLRHLRVERLAAPELVSPLAGPDALLRYGSSEEAVAEYQLIAADHPDSDIGGQALLRALAERYRHPVQDDPLRNSLYAALRSRGPGPFVDEADRIRAVGLWASGQGQLAMGVARDLVARRPDLNPVLAFLSDRNWSLPPMAGNELVRLLAATPNSVGVSLPNLGLQDLSPLAGRRAWSVNISDNAIRNIAPVAYSGCTYINASRNQINDVSPLARMKALTRLYLADNQVTNISALASLPVLRVIDLAGNQLTSVNGLPPRVLDLNVARNPLATLEGLPVETLERLAIQETQISDLSPLGEARQMTTLDISGTPIREVSPLLGLPIANLRASQMADFDPSTIPLTSLTRLQMTHCPQLAPERIPSAVWATLQIADLSHNAFHEWPAVEAPELRSLLLSDCQMQNLGYLSEMDGLRTLDLHGNSLANVDALAKIVSLQRLDVRDNQLTSVAGLLANPPTELAVTGNPLTAESCRELIAAGRRLRRYDLVWQGVSMLIELTGSVDLLRDVAISHGGHRYAVFASGRLLSVDEARDMARTCGGRLAVISNAELNRELASSLPISADPWCGMILQDHILRNEEAEPLNFTADLPPVQYRGYSCLPGDGGNVVLLFNATWGLAPTGRANGAIIEWDEAW